MIFYKVQTILCLYSHKLTAATLFYLFINSFFFFFFFFFFFLYCCQTTCQITLFAMGKSVYTHYIYRCFYFIQWQRECVRCIGKVKKRINQASTRQRSHVTPFSPDAAHQICHVLYPHSISRSLFSWSLPYRNFHRKKQQKQN